VCVVRVKASSKALTLHHLPPQVTSPIRRFADLLAHLQLKAHLHGRPPALNEHDLERALQLSGAGATRLPAVASCRCYSSLSPALNSPCCRVMSLLQLSLTCSQLSLLSRHVVATALSHLLSTLLDAFRLLQPSHQLPRLRQSHATPLFPANAFTSSASLLGSHSPRQVSIDRGFSISR
jgi:hypothetical protein